MFLPSGKTSQPTARTTLVSGSGATLRRLMSVTLALTVLGLTPLNQALELLGPSVADAQSNPREARKAFREATQAYKDGDFTKAAELFERAYSFDAKPQLLFNIGQAYKDAGDYESSERYFQRYLEELPSAPNRDDVLAILFELQQLKAASMALVTIDATEGLNVFVDAETEARCQTPCIVNLYPGEHSVAVEGEKTERETQTVTPEPAQELVLSFSPALKPEFMARLLVLANVKGAVLMVDGQPAGSLPMARPLSLDPGVHTLAVMIGGETRWRGDATLVAGEVARVEVPLEDDGGDGEGGGASAGSLGIAAFTLWGVGAASLAGGALFGLSAGGIESDLDAQAGRGEAPNAELIDQGERQKMLANLFFGVGVTAVATGVVLYIFDEGAPTERPQSAERPLLPELVPTEGGALLRIQTDF